jgi:hypothetical protein
MPDRMQTQRDEFDAAYQLSEHLKDLSYTAVVDDDYPMVRHRYEGALTNFILAMKANGRFDDIANRYGIVVKSG